MKRFEHELSTEEKRLLSYLESGAISYAESGGVSGRPSTVFLKSTAGVLCLTAQEVSLDRKFECFPISVSKANELGGEAIDLVGWKGRNVVSVLTREDYLCETEKGQYEAIGDNPLLQKSGRPGRPPPRAISSCIYPAGILVRNKMGENLLIFSDTFPFLIKVVAGQKEVATELKSFEEKHL